MFNRNVAVSGALALMGLVLHFVGASALHADSPVPAAQLTAVIDGASVRITGARPGASLYLIAMTREWTPAAVRVQEVVESLVDSDSDGALQYESGAPIPDASIWVAVDSQTGESVIFVPEAGVLCQISFPPAALHVPAPNQSPVLDIDAFAELELFVVRPGDSLYRATASDGGSLDLDQENNVGIRADLGGLADVRGQGLALGRLRGDETLFGIDPRSLTLVTIGAPNPPSGGGAR